MKTQRTHQNGFTLIELLVVIAIIAMLLSILMPALSRIKKQAQQVVCMANLSQLGVILTLYTEDHDGHFFAGYYKYTDPNGTEYASSRDDLWPYALESYYQLPELCVCPAGSFSAPQIHDASYLEEVDGNLSGGYGLNGWLCDTPKEVLETEGRDTANSWRTMDYSGSSKIPMMADAIWYTGRPLNSDLPPENFELDSYWRSSKADVEALKEDSTNHMRRFCVKRHPEKRVNVSFMDGSVQPTNVEQLWQLKWHKNFTSAPLSEWQKTVEDPNLPDVYFF